MEVAKHLKGVEPAKLVAESVLLSSFDAGKVAEILKGMYGDPAKGAPYISYDEQNAIIIHGTADQIKDVKLAIGVITNQSGESSGGSSKNISIPLKDASPRNLADALEPILRDMGYTPRVIRPGIEDIAPMKKDLPKAKDLPKEKEPAEEKKGPMTSVPIRNPKFVAATANQQFSDPQEVPKKELPKERKARSS